jgi:hypothetical protein
LARALAPIARSLFWTHAKNAVAKLWDLSHKVGYLVQLVVKYGEVGQDAGEIKWFSASGWPMNIASRLRHWST